MSLWGSLVTRWRRRGVELAPVPRSRPLEAIAADLRRLGDRFHGLDPRASYIKTEAVRGAYDRVLAECCATLELTHLLGVLAPGPERDTERRRVEGLLTDSGVRFPHPA
jgi:hypothetical protein